MRVSCLLLSSSSSSSSPFSSPSPSRFLTPRPSSIILHALLLSASPPSMAALIRSAAADMKAAAARRLRRGRALAEWQRQILGAALITTAVTALLIWDVPNPLTVGLLSTSVPNATAALLSVEESLPSTLTPALPLPPLLQPFPRRAAAVLSPSPNNSTAETPPVLPPPPPIGNSDNKKAKRSSSGPRDRPARLERPYWRMRPDEALMHAKREIANAPLVTDDPDLYAPLFRNVSAFKRSYELMESILKVYIYPDGARPIFHTPELRGIYASEGWFLKLMEDNTRFVVKDPNKAHLFYLPYSARQLEHALYVPDSHNLRPLSLFLRDYVNSISAKYPFWNRTGGADHFLVACHDWGPYTTTEHAELCKNTIKALCNADVSEGIFVRGKDVSLPETTIRTPKKPLRYVGGKPVSKRPILAFFAGNVHGRVRPILLKYWEGKDEDMRIYGPLPMRVARNMSYIHHMKSSRFCICPMGFEVNSPRIVEALYYECVPVIIADNFVLPFEEVLDWNAFSVVVAEKDIPNLKNILMGISLRKYIAMHTNVVRLQKHFLWHARPIKYDIFHMILHSIWFNRLNQIQVQH